MKKNTYLKNFFSNIGALDNSSKKYWPLSILIIFTIFFVVFIRYPDLVINYRFWGEENIYFEMFLHSDNWVDGFDSMIYPGYYVFFSRVAALFATFVDLELAPFVTTLIGFSVLVLPILILFLTKCKYWNSLQDKLILSLFLIFSCSTGEIWLNSTNVHFIFPVIVFLILLDDNLTNFTKRLIYSLLLFVSSITGPITLLMSPFFLIKYVQTKHRQFLFYCLILFIAGLIQLSYYIISIEVNTISPSRFNGEFLSIGKVYHSIASNIIFPLFGYFSSVIFKNGLEVVNNGINDIPYIMNIMNTYPALVSVSEFFINIKIFVNTIIISAVLIFFAWLAKRSNSEEMVYFLSLFIYISILIAFLSLGGESGFRYSFFTGFVLLFYLYRIYVSNKIANVKYILLISILIGVVEYYPRMISYTSPDWPIWTEEVYTWRGDSSYKPLIWPSIREGSGVWPERRSIWSINLNKDEWKESKYKYSDEIISYIMGNNN